MFSVETSHILTLSFGSVGCSHKYPLHFGDLKSNEQLDHVWYLIVIVILKLAQQPSPFPKPTVSLFRFPLVFGCFWHVDPRLKCKFFNVLVGVVSISTISQHLRLCCSRFWDTLASQSPRQSHSSRSAHMYFCMYMYVQSLRNERFESGWFSGGRPEKKGLWRGFSVLNCWQVARRSQWRFPVTRTWSWHMVALKHSSAAAQHRAGLQF